MDLTPYAAMVFTFGFIGLLITAAFRSWFNFHRPWVSAVLAGVWFVVGSGWVATFITPAAMAKAAAESAAAGANTVSSGSVSGAANAPGNSTSVTSDDLGPVGYTSPSNSSGHHRAWRRHYSSGVYLHPRHAYVVHQYVHHVVHHHR